MRIQPLRGIRTWALTALACGLIATGGCLDLGGSDDDDNPAGDGNAELDNEVAWGTAGNAVDATNGIIENLTDWMENGIQATGGRATSWDPVANAWTVSGTEDYDDGDATGTVTFTYVVQFTAEGVPQEQPDDFTDQIDITLDATNEGNYHPDGEAWTIDYDWTAHEEAIANALPEGGGTVVADGTVTGSTLAHVGEASIPAQQNMSWDADLVLPDQGCATGTVTGEMLPWSFAAALDGSEEMIVSLFYLGDLVTSETRSAACEVPGGE